MRDAASYRMRRVNEAIREIIGTALTHDLKDPRIGFVTLTGVDTTPDLSHAKVFLSVYGKQADKEATLEGLRAARSHLQRLIGDELKIRRIPTLEFVYDATVDRGMRIQALLKSSGIAGVQMAGDSSQDESPAHPGEGEAQGHGGDEIQGGSGTPGEGGGDHPAPKEW
jgi:ribosome-binding factor A